MCSVIIVNKQLKDFPLIIAANRDEDYNRKSSNVQILNNDSNFIIGGKDEQAGGSWLAVNKHSLFATITNQGRTDKKLKSRGLIILELLKRTNLEEALVYIKSLSPSEFNGFNIIFGNQEKIYVGYSYILNDCVLVDELSAGVHLITSDVKFNTISKSATFMHEELNFDENSKWDINTSWLEYYKKLKFVLASKYFKIKVKKSEDNVPIGYCTKSSSILAFSEEGLARYKFHDRIIPRKKKPDGNSFVPRYKDYIELFRTGKLTNENNNEESDVENE